MTDKSAIIAAAQKLTSKGQIDRAVSEWEKLLDNRNDGNIYNTIGDLYLRKGAEKEAKESFLKAADIFRKDGFYPKAIAIYKKVLNITSNDVDALIALAKLNADRGLIGNAVENYYRAAEIYNRDGSAEKATMIVEKMLQLAPSDVNTRAKIAYLYFRIGLRERAANEYASIASSCLEKNELENALEFYNKAIEYDPGNIQGLAGLSKLAVKSNNIDQAFGYLEKALSADPNNKDILLTYSRLAIDSNRMDDARRALVILTEIDPSNTESKKLLGAFHLKEGRCENAWEEFQPLIDSALDAKNWSEAHQYLQNFKETNRIPVKQRLLRICKARGDDSIYCNDLKELAALHENEGSNEDALQLYREALALSPADNALSEKLKDLENRLGIAQPSIDIEPEKHPEAGDNSTAPLEIETDNISDKNDDLQALFDQFEKHEEKAIDYEAHYIAGLGLKQKGLLDEAIKELEVAAKDPDKKLRNSTMLALCYKEKRDYPPAIAEFNKIIGSMSPADSTYLHVKYELAQAHLNNNEADRALELFSEIQAVNPDFKDVSSMAASLKVKKAPEQADKPKLKRDRVSYI